MKNNQTLRRKILLVSVFVMVLLDCMPLRADPVIHPFKYWGTMNRVDKLNFYVGWTNGFLAARGPLGLELATCLDALDFEQALAMIDKRYKDHPERWSRPITQQMLGALTARGGPCEGKNPLPADSE